MSLQDAGASEFGLVLVDIPQPDGLVATTRSNERTCNIKRVFVNDVTTENKAIIKVQIESRIASKEASR